MARREGDAGDGLRQGQPPGGSTLRPGRRDVLSHPVVSPSLKLQPHVAWQMVGGLAVVMDLASGRTVGLNPSASFIWERLAAGSGDGLVGDFAAKFHLDDEAAKCDVEQFVGYLVQQNLLVA